MWEVFAGSCDSSFGLCSNRKTVSTHCICVVILEHVFEELVIINEDIILSDVS